MSGPKPLLEVTGLSAPASVLYDEQADLYLVSNINGSPFAKDDNGFIAQVAPSGETRSLRWIDGARADVQLNAPKGMALLGDTLYVADLDTVRCFDRKTGAFRRAIPIAGATFLNAIAAGTNAIYVSDTGVKEGFKPSGTAAIYEVRDATAKAVVRGEELLHGPNGLAIHKGQIWSVTFGSNDLYRVFSGGKPANVTKLPKGQLDGLVVLPDGTFLVSSWEAAGIYTGRPGGEFTLAIPDRTSPAGIGFDTKRSRVLVPLLSRNRVEVFEWTPAARTRMGRTGAR